MKNHEHVYWKDQLHADPDEHHKKKSKRYSHTMEISTTTDGCGTENTDFCIIERKRELNCIEVTLDTIAVASSAILPNID